MSNFFKSLPASPPTHRFLEALWANPKCFWHRPRKGRKGTVADGPHDQLHAASRIYRELYDHQMLGTSHAADSATVH